MKGSKQALLGRIENFISADVCWRLLSVGHDGEHWVRGLKEMGSWLLRKRPPARTVAA